MRIAICEDYHPEATLIKGYIRDFYAQKLTPCEIDVFEKTSHFLWNFEQDSYDIIFMDVHLGDGNGVDTVRKIREKDTKCLVVFTTSSANHAVHAFDLNATHYLLKPVKAEKIYEALEKCNEILGSRTKFIAVKEGHTPRKVYLNEIIYVDVYRDVCSIHTKYEIVKTRTTLSKLETLIRETGEELTFVRCHQSYLVNMFFIKSVEDACFIMANGDTVSISKRDKSAVKSTFEEYVFNYQ